MNRLASIGEFALCLDRLHLLFSLKTDIIKLFVNRSLGQWSRCDGGARGRGGGRQSRRLTGIAHWAYVSSLTREEEGQSVELKKSRST